MPISAIVFGGRRREVAPLVYEARNWQHGVAGRRLGGIRDHGGRDRRGRRRAPRSDGDETVRRLQLRRLLAALARRWASASRIRRKLFHVNWFRRDAAGKFLWPGYGDNLRVMEWVLKRCAGQVGADESAIGYLPKPADLNLKGVDVSEATMKELLAVTPEAWRKETAEMREYLKEFGARAPAEMSAELDGIEKRLG